MQKVAIFTIYDGQTQLSLESYNPDLYTLEDFCRFKRSVVKGILRIIPYDYGFVHI